MTKSVYSEIFNTPLIFSYQINSFQQLTRILKPVNETCVHKLRFRFGLVFTMHGTNGKLYCIILTIYHVLR